MTFSCWWKGNIGANACHLHGISEGRTRSVDLFQDLRCARAGISPWTFQEKRYSSLDCLVLESLVYILSYVGYNSKLLGTLLIKLFSNLHLITSQQSLFEIVCVHYCS